MGERVELFLVDTRPLVAHRQLGLALVQLGHAQAAEFEDRSGEELLVPELAVEGAIEVTELWA